MSNRNHPWCSDPARDEAVRAAEDGRLGPLPTLEEAIADPFTKTASICETESAVEPVIPAADANGGGGGGLRTERVTLEVTHDCAYPAAEWVLEVVQEACSDPGESVRVVEEVRLPPTIIRLTDEREAARRERDAAKDECERLRRVMGGHASMEIEKEIAVEEAWEFCDLPPHWPEDEPGTSQRYAESMRLEIVKLRARVAELEAAPAANAGGEKQEPVLYGVFWHGRVRVESFDVRDTSEQAARLAANDGTVVPLYAAPQPPRGWLTEEEREVILSVLPFEDEKGAKTLTMLLARPTPPRVKRPKYFPMSWAHERDDAWIAAIREAGGEVE